MKIIYVNKIGGYIHHGIKYTEHSGSSGTSDNGWSYKMAIEHELSKNIRPGEQYQVEVNGVNKGTFTKTSSVKVSMKEILSKTMIKLKKGTGFWCLDYYPWGGDFHRLSKDVECTDYEVLKNFNDGTPSMITTIIDGKKCGFQL